MSEAGPRHDLDSRPANVLLAELLDEYRTLDRRERAGIELLEALRAAKRSARAPGAPSFLETAPALASLGLDPHQVARAATAMLDPGWEGANHTGVMLLGEPGAGSMDAARALARAIAHPNGAVRRSVPSSVGMLGPIATQTMLELLTVADPNVRALAVSSLGQIYQSGRVDEPPIERIAALLEDPDSEVRREAASALGFVGAAGCEALPALIRTLDDPEWPVRKAALFAIGSFREAGSTAAPALFDRADDPEPLIRYALATTLMHLGASALDLAIAELGSGKAGRRALAVRTVARMAARQDSSSDPPAESAEVIRKRLAPHQHAEGEILELLAAIESGAIALTTDREPQDVYSGLVYFRCTHGWELAIHNRCNRWNGVREVGSPDGRLTDEDTIRGFMPRVVAFEPGPGMAWERYGFPGHGMRRDERWTERA